METVAYSRFFKLFITEDAEIPQLRCPWQRTAAFSLLKGELFSDVLTTALHGDEYLSFSSKNASGCLRAIAAVAYRSVLHEGEQLLARVYAQLAVYLVGMRLNRMGRDVELVLDVGGTASLGQQVKHLDFARGQVVGFGDGGALRLPGFP